MAEAEEKMESKWQSLITRISPVLKQFIVILLGVIAYFIFSAVMPRPVRRSVLEPELPEVSSKAPPLLVRMFRGAEMLRSSAVQISAFLMFLFMAFYHRDREKSWVYALLVRFGLPSILFHWVLHWF
jgi:hypothetical protein